ncbi:MAG: UDP-N-acetylmuramate dehydrogenase [Chlorobiaceae bacterium]
MADSPLPTPSLSNVDLAARSYYGIGGKARYLALPECPAQLSALLRWNRLAQHPLALMGSGSNTLFSDDPFPGIVISLLSMSKMFWISETELFCEAGAENSAVAEKLLAASRRGGEWLYKLPGQIGPSVRMNARCFGGELSLVSAAVLTATLDGRLLWRTPEEIFLGYKETSLMKSREIVAAVLLRFPEKGSPEEIERLMHGHEDERNKKHHFDFPSCGSTFKNNYDAGRSSGSIFEELGFKGSSEGGAAVSSWHANFIFNKGGATARDVLTLAARMKSAASKELGADLELELECIGLFERPLLDACAVSYRVAQSDSSKGWAGLFWMASEKEESDVLPVFPETLLHGPLTGYHSRDREFPPGFMVEIVQLRSLQEARLEPKAPFLRWTTFHRGSAGFEPVPPSSIHSGGFMDGLWNYGVSELFIGTRDGYIELEMTPEGEWIAILFDGIRKRSPENEIPNEDLWKEDVRLFRSDSAFGMELSWNLIRTLVEGESLSLQCCASSGRGEYALFPWWNHKDFSPDFHQPERFTGVRLR